MYRANIKYRKCLMCKTTFEQAKGTVAMRNPSYGKCPYCGGDSVFDEDANLLRRREIEDRFNKLYSATMYLEKK